MRFIPNTGSIRREMLAEIGVFSFEELIAAIPESVRFRGDLDIPGPLSEIELLRQVSALSRRNGDFSVLQSLVGAGAYRHYVPPAVSALLSRQEFYTAYTPYQPELSQGTLQATFEYQSFLARLTGMEVIIPSIYDGASATAEAALMALRLSKKSRILVSASLHPHYRSTLETYTAPHRIELVEIPCRDGLTDRNFLKQALNDQTAAVIVQSPNFYGGIESISELSLSARNSSVLFIQVIAEALSLGLLKSPGEMEVDILAGEAQSLGMELNFGGPYNGFLGTRKKYLRQLPGRIVGETVDRDKKRCFVMTARAREQDIRREKATSCICSNHGLNILASAIYLSLLGTEGLYRTALVNTRGAHYLEKKLVETGKFERVFSSSFFNEFVLRARIPMDEVRGKLLAGGFIPPLGLGDYLGDDSLADTALFAVTEILSRQDLDRAVELLAKG